MPSIIEPTKNRKAKHRPSENVINEIAQRHVNNLTDDNLQLGDKPIYLTRCEQEVLMLVSEGDSSKTAAEMLCVSKRTVEYHLSNVFVKLAVSNRVQAVNKAKRLQLIPTPDIA